MKDPDALPCPCCGGDPLRAPTTGAYITTGDGFPYCVTCGVVFDPFPELRRAVARRKAAA